MATRLPRIGAHRTFGIVLSFLLISWGAVALFDVFNVRGLGSWFISHASYHMYGGNRAPFFYVWFDDRSPVEWVQWICLGGLGLLGAWMGQALKSTRYRQVRMFWLLIGGAAVILLIEDAGSPRHRIVDFLNILSPYFSHEEPFTVVFELFIYFPLLAALPIYALYHYYEQVRDLTWVSRYLWIGFFFYACAALMSASSGIGYWYNGAGAELLTLFSDEMLREDIYRHPELGFWLMDTLVEESIELIGAAGLLSSGVAQYELYRTAQTTD